MRLRTFMAKFIGKFTYWFLQIFFNGGSSLPGKLALKIDPTILKILAKDYEIIVITGTNGKTLTTSLTANILRQQFDYVLTNSTGSNMIQGIVSTFLNVKSKKKKKIAVLEIDEASLAKVTEDLNPKLFVFTNIFRDQMDRYGEIYTTYQMLLNGANKAPDATILCNGDSPLFALCTTKNSQKFYGFNHLSDKEQMAHYNTEGVLCPKCQKILHYKMITYANLGKYYCSNCGFHRPQLDFCLSELKKVDNTSSAFVIDGMSLTLEVGGVYNVYNALAATAASEYYQIPYEKIKAGLACNEKVFGRQEVISIYGKKVTIILVKNPVGINQAIDVVSRAPFSFTLVTLLNSQYADGIDTSWIWDGNYEKLIKLNLPKIIVGGERHKDMMRRIIVAGVKTEKIIDVDTNFKRLLNEIKIAPTEHIYIFTTYTAMLNLRKKLANADFLKGKF
ncbi:MAG: Mur ligase family protein [Streptococcaceae bacterium]|nr:Mur ligase family protein [Streptococcaceae bacterium]